MISVQFKSNDKNCIFDHNFVLFLSLSIKIDQIWIKRSKKMTLMLIKRLKKSIKRPKKSNKRLKMLIYIKRVKLYWKSLIKFDHLGYSFNFFLLNLNFSMDFWAGGIDFVTKIWIQTMNSDQKIQSKDDLIPIQVKIWL